MRPVAEAARFLEGRRVYGAPACAKSSSAAAEEELARFRGRGFSSAQANNGIIVSRFPPDHGRSDSLLPSFEAQPQYFYPYFMNPKGESTDQ